LKKLKTQKEIMHNWIGDINKPLVSIQCLTYNHENYIEDAIEGFLIQDTDFPFEVIIHDDASTDDTATIIKKYEERYPKIIKPIYQEKNKFQEGKRNEIGDTIYKQIRGKYIALCEGDDYWIDKDKLQLQLDAMMEDENIHLSFHPGKRLDCLENNSEKIIGVYSEEVTLLPFEVILTRPHGMIPTSSVVFSVKAKPMMIEFLNLNPLLTQGDIFMQMISAYNGGAKFINKPMSIYRYQTEGSWTHTYKVDNKFNILVLSSKIRYLISFHKFIGRKHEKLFANIIFGVVCELAILLDNINHKQTDFINDMLISIIEKKLVSLDGYNSEIVLYGASTLTKWFLDKFPNIKVKYILDADINKHNSLFNTKIVKHPSKIVNKDDIVLITLWGREYQISIELEEYYGLRKKNIMVIDNLCFDDFTKLDFIIED